MFDVWPWRCLAFITRYIFKLLLVFRFTKKVCSQGKDCNQAFQTLKQDYTKMPTTFHHYHTLSSTFVIPITPPITPQSTPRVPRRAIYRKLDYRALNGLPVPILSLYITKIEPSINTYIRGISNQDYTIVQPGLKVLSELFYEKY